MLLCGMLVQLLALDPRERDSLSVEVLNLV